MFFVCVIQSKLVKDYIEKLASINPNYLFLFTIYVGAFQHLLCKAFFLINLISPVEIPDKARDQLKAL